MRHDINHRDDNTTSLCEGSHSAVKALVRASGSECQRVDKLVFFLLRVVAETYSYRDVRKHHSKLLCMHRRHLTGIVAVRHLHVCTL
jgi:hypothetical protein